ncbi:MAG: UDP-N-acetylglucosamine 2-epimerase (non-hydrolyzing), partial [Oscillospiraceae bacterium]|nr:UDP-N-acetylglucosamine 2-epimerase (non-hydrolyzing) [Oscillospiraceae bacterium]
GKRPALIHVTGNTEIDALRYTVRDDYSHPILDGLNGGTLLLMTIHRRENLGEPMRSIFRAVRRFSHDFPEIRVVYPVHLNPQVQTPAREILGGAERVTLIDPLEVTDFHNFLSRAKLVLSDSGGVQEDAAGLGKPLLVARDVTERPEGLDAGTLKLVGTDEDAVYSNLAELHSNHALYAKMASAPNPFGDGFASAKIADAILTGG